MFRSFTQQKRKIAVALEYKSKHADDAPRVVAKGYDHAADTITRLADSHDIPIHEDPELAQLLASSEIGDFIPPTAFLAVASVLRIIYERSPSRSPLVNHQTTNTKNVSTS